MEKSSIFGGLSGKGHSGTSLYRVYKTLIKPLHPVWIYVVVVDSFGLWDALGNGITIVTNHQAIAAIV